MISEQPRIQEALAPGPRYALDTCALAYGALQEPTLLLSSKPAWERALRRRIGDQLFMLGDPARPPSQPWVGAVWLEPQRRVWRSGLQLIARELPRGGLLSVVLSLPL